MPNRIIKDSINESRGLTSCSFFAQDLYKRLITYADDYGRFNADPQIMVARLYPRELSVVSFEELTEGLIELVGVEKIKFYTSSGRKEIYGCFPHWEEHQRVRDGKKRLPDPEDTAVNDWYLRRFIPTQMKADIIQRDKFRCQACGKHVAEMTDAYKLVKMATGCFHIDHIVPCNQGGRATMENLRLLCPKCNLSRKKTFTYEEILSFSGELPQSAASCGELRRVAASCGELPPNPIQSNIESESESNPESHARAREDDAFSRFWAVYPKKVGKLAAQKSFAKVKAPVETLIAAVERQKLSSQWQKDGGQYIPNPATWLNQGRWEDDLEAAADAGGSRSYFYGKYKSMEDDE